MGGLSGSQVALVTKLKISALAYLPLFKFRLTVPLLFVSAVSMLLAGGWGQRFFFLLLSGGLALGGSACLNHYLDRDIDALMIRTKNRPIPSGRLSPPTALLIGIPMLFLSAILSLATLNLMTTLFILLGVLLYLLGYTVWLKRRHWLNIFVGGLAAGVPALAGWSAACAEISFLPLFLMALILLWTPPHIWSLALFYREDYRRAYVPMLPAIVDERRAAQFIFLCISLLFPLSLLPSILGYSGWLYLGGAICGGMFFLLSGIRMLKKPSLAQANFKLSGPYIVWLLLLLLLDSYAF